MIWSNRSEDIAGYVRGVAAFCTAWAARAVCRKSCDRNIAIGRSFEERRDKGKNN